MELKVTCPAFAIVLMCVVDVYAFSPEAASVNNRPDGGSMLPAATPSTSVQANVSPIVTVQPDPVSGSVPLRVNLTGTAHDTDGTIQAYQWFFDMDVESEIVYVSGATINVEEEYEYTHVGFHQITFKAWDDDGGIGFASKTVNVTNTPPQLEEVVFRPAVPRAGKAVVATPIGFFDEDQGQEQRFSYSWWVNDEPCETYQDACPEYLPKHCFTYGDTIRVKVTPHDGYSAGVPVSASAVVERVPTLVLDLEPRSLAMQSGESDQSLVELVAAEAKAATFCLEATCPMLPQVRFSFKPNPVVVSKEVPRGISLLTVEAPEDAIPGLAVFYVRAAGGELIQHVTGNLRVLESESMSLSLESDKSSAEFGEVVGLRGNLRPASNGTCVAAVSTGPYCETKSTRTDADGQYQLFFRPSQVGTSPYRFYATCMPEGEGTPVFSEITSVTMERSSGASIVLSASYAAPLTETSDVHVYGQVQAVSVSYESLEVAVDILRDGTVHQTVDAILNATGEFSFPLPVNIGSSTLTVQAKWSGDSNQWGAVSAPLHLSMSSRKECALTMEGQPNDSITREAIQFLGSVAAGTFRHRGFPDTQNKTITGQDETKQRFLDEIRGFSKYSQNFVYLVGRGTQTGVYLSDGSVVSATDISLALGTRSLTCVILVEADFSGVFHSLTDSVPSGQKRIVVTATSPHETTKIGANGVVSFSREFLQGIRDSCSLETCFTDACNELNTNEELLSRQSPGMSSANIDPGTVVMGTLTHQHSRDHTRPLLSGLQLSTSADASWKIVTDVIENCQVASVTSFVSLPVSGKLLQLQLQASEQHGVYQSPPFRFATSGLYVIGVVAVDEAGNQSIVESLRVPIRGFEKGDLSRDGIIDGADLLSFSSCWRHSNMPSSGYDDVADFDDDGKVDHSDLLSLLGLLR